MHFVREILLRNVKYALQRVRIYFISLDAEHQISQFLQEIISHQALLDISLIDIFELL